MPETTEPAATTQDALRSWDMHAGRHTLHDGTEEYIDFGDPWYVRAYGHTAVHPVRLVEDPEGQYRGWVETGEDVPTMIYRREVFPICFPYGVRAAIEAEQGEPVCLRPEPREED